MDNRESNGASKISEIFIGARNLGEEVYNIMPTFDLLLKQIEQIREQSYNETSMTEFGANYRKDVNNTIGIFGARGTGKTSVLYTLIDKLRSSGYETATPSSNIVLGIIEPDHFGDNTKIMGSIVGLLKKTADQQLKVIEKLGIGTVKGFQDYFNKGMFRSNNPLQSSLNELIEYHMYTENEYRQLLLHTYDDLATHIKKSARLLTPDIEFKERLHQFITILISNQRAILNNITSGLVGGNGEGEREPLLFLFIDDIDLKMMRSREIMEAILQYANHPHVVTVLSGDYDILLESVTLALLQDEKLFQSNLESEFQANDRETIKERKQNLAHEYIKKIIPPARRHQLLQWNENTIPRFAFGDRTLMSQLDKLFVGKNLFSYKSDDSSNLYPIVKSYSIFDRTPRGIVNVYYHIHEMNERFTDFWREDSVLGEREKRERFTIVKSLVDTILLSSTKLAAAQRDILEQFIQWGQDSGNTYLDYSKIEMISKREIERETSKKKNISENNPPKQEDSLLLPLLIVGEIIRSLLEDVRLNEEVCNTLQLQALRGILQLDREPNLSPNYYGRIVNELFSFISFQNALFFTNRLLDRKEWLTHPYGMEAGQVTTWTEKLDRWMLTQINELISNGKEENLLSRLYYHQYVRSKQSESSLKDAQFILDYLKKASESIGEYVYYKSLYEYPPGNEPWKLGILLENTGYAEELFIHLIVEVHSWSSVRFEEEIRALQAEHDQLDRIGEKSPADARLRSILAAVIKKQQKNEKFTPAQKNRVDKLIIRFYEELFKRLREKLTNNQFIVEWREETAVVQAINDFKSGRRAGISEKTKYKLTKQAISNEIEKQETYRQFSDRRNTVKRLANNYYVWYGRQEASSLLQILNKQAYMAPSNLEPDELWVLRHLDIYLKQVHEAARVDEAYEKVKEEMRHKLDKGFNEAMELVVTDLNDLGIDLDEDEELDENA